MGRGRGRGRGRAGCNRACEVARWGAGVWCRLLSTGLVRVQGSQVCSGRVAVTEPGIQCLGLIYFLFKNNLGQCLTGALGHVGGALGPLVVKARPPLRREGLGALGWACCCMGRSNSCSRCPLTHQGLDVYFPATQEIRMNLGGPCVNLPGGSLRAQSNHGAQISRAASSKWGK